MPVVPCPNCAATFRVAESAVGNVRCPQCAAMFPLLLPTPEASKSAPPKPAPAFEVVDDEPASPPPRPPAPKSATQSKPARPAPAPVDDDYTLDEDFTIDEEETKPQKKQSLFNNIETEKPQPKRRDDDDDDRPLNVRRDEDDEDDDRPRKKRRDNDEGETPRPKRKKRKRSKSTGVAEDSPEAKLQEAQIALILIGLLTVGVNVFDLMNIDNTLAEARQKGVVITESLLNTAKMIDRVAIVLGLCLVTLGGCVYKAPVLCTLAGFVLYLGAIITFGVLIPETLQSGIVMKIFIVLALANGIRSAAAYESER